MSALLKLSDVIAGGVGGILSSMKVMGYREGTPAQNALEKMIMSSAGRMLANASNIQLLEKDFPLREQYLMSAVVNVAWGVLNKQSGAKALEDGMTAVLTSWLGDFVLSASGMPDRNLL